MKDFLFRLLDWVVAAFVGVVLYLIITANTPTAIDVYRGKTTLEITYRDSMAVDSVVVYKKMTMENDKTNLAFIELMVLIIATCSLSQCIDSCVTTNQILCIEKEIHTIAVKDSVGIDSTVVYKAK